MLIALKLATVKLIAVTVARRRQLLISLSAEIILLSKKFCTVNLMIYCRNSRASQMLKSLKHFSLVTTLNLKSMTAETFPLLLLCKSMFYQPKDSVNRSFSKVSWCFQVRSSSDVISFSSHLIHITPSWSCCVYFLPHIQ